VAPAQTGLSNFAARIDRGELPADINLDLVLDSLYGPIYMRFLIRHDKLAESFADEICGWC